MDNERALELMREQLSKADSLTATLYKCGIEALEQVNNKKTINQQKEELYMRICNEICKHQEKANGNLQREYDLVNTICPKCPLYELTR